MSCLQCGQHVTLLRRLVLGGEFCSDAHKRQYQEDYRSLILKRLLQAQSEAEDRRIPPRTNPLPPPAAPPDPDEPRAWGGRVHIHLRARDSAMRVDRRTRYHQITWPVREPAIPSLFLEPVGELQPAIADAAGMAVTTEPFMQPPVEQTHLQPVLVDDAAGETCWPALTDVAYPQDAGCRFFPLAMRRHKVGTLSFGYLGPSAMNPSDLRSVERITARITEALATALEAEESRQYQQQLAQDRQRHRALLEITGALISHATPEAMFTSIAESLHMIVPYEHSWLALCDPDSPFLRIHQYAPGTGGPGELRCFQMPSEEMLAYTAPTSREPVVVNKIENSSFPRDLSIMLCGDSYQCVCSVPLVTPDRILGTLNLASVQLGAFPAESVDFLAQIAAHFAIAIENLSARSEVQRLRERLAGGTVSAREPESRKMIDDRPDLVALQEHLNAAGAIDAFSDREAGQPHAAPVAAGSDPAKLPEKERIIQALEAANWRVGGVSGAAAQLGMKRTTLHSKMKRLGITQPIPSEKRC